jgi:triosephosphate isomerase
VIRTPLIVGNWKMHKTVAEARALIKKLRAASMPRGVEVVVAPPFTALAAAHDALRGGTIGLGAQTMHYENSGAFTGEISPVMLRELGVRWVILGHSERRAQCGENDEAIALKVRAALAHELTPIVAVGETAEEHERGETIAKVTRQTRTALAGLSPGAVAGCVVAYEPIWAIGSGKHDEPPQSDTVIAALRTSVDGLADARMLYGGSMKPANARAFMEQPNIDGGLVGGASLEAASFLAIVEAARVRAGAR